MTTRTKAELEALQNNATDCSESDPCTCCGQPWPAHGVDMGNAAGEVLQQALDQKALLERLADFIDPSFITNAKDAEELLVKAREAAR